MNIAPDIQTSDKYKATNPFNNKPQFKQNEQQRGKNVQTQNSNPFSQYPKDSGGEKEIIGGEIMKLLEMTMKEWVHFVMYVVLEMDI